MQQSVIYFEDDRPLAKMITHFLQGEGYQIFHYTSLPSGGVEALIADIKEPPFMVLMDVRLEGENGFDICAMLKKNVFFKKSPVLFMSGLIDEEDILQAYEAGAFDYLTKPVQLKSLAIKCLQVRDYRHQTEALENQISTTEQMAFDAMTASSELGSILRFHESIANITKVTDLATMLMRDVANFGVSASVMFAIGNDEPIYQGSNGQVHQLERDIFGMLKHQGRIYSWNNRTLFNYDAFSVLIRSMPVDDEMRYGTLKDQFCLLFDGVEHRIRGIVNERQVAKSEENIHIIAKTIGKLVVDMEAHNLALSDKFEKIINELEVDVGEDIANLNLMESEEVILMGHIGKAMKDATLVFDETKVKEADYRQVMVKLLGKLNQ